MTSTAPTTTPPATTTAPPPTHPPPPPATATTTGAPTQPPTTTAPAPAPGGEVVGRPRKRRESMDDGDSGEPDAKKARSVDSIDLLITADKESRPTATPTTRLVSDRAGDESVAPFPDISHLSVLLDSDGAEIKPDGKFAKIPDPKHYEAKVTQTAKTFKHFLDQSHYLLELVVAMMDRCKDELSPTTFATVITDVYQRTLAERALPASERNVTRYVGFLVRSCPKVLTLSSADGVTKWSALWRRLATKIKHVTNVALAIKDIFYTFCTDSMPPISVINDEPVDRAAWLYNELKVRTNLLDNAIRVLGAHEVGTEASVTAEPTPFIHEAKQLTAKPTNVPTLTTTTTTTSSSSSGAGSASGASASAAAVTASPVTRGHVPVAKVYVKTGTAESLSRGETGDVDITLIDGSGARVSPSYDVNTVDGAIEITVKLEVKSPADSPALAALRNTPLASVPAVSDRLRIMMDVFQNSSDPRDVLTYGALRAMSAAGVSGEVLLKHVGL